MPAGSVALSTESEAPAVEPAGNLLPIVLEAICVELPAVDVPAFDTSLLM